MLAGLVMAGKCPNASTNRGLATKQAARQPLKRPSDHHFRHLAAFDGFPEQAPDLFPGTRPWILALDVDEERIPAMVGNLRAAGLTGPSHEHSMVIGQRDVRTLSPEFVAGLLQYPPEMKGCVLFL